MTLASQHTCSGCGSCAAACPQNCIELVPDFEGFRYPQVDSERCIGCDSCQLACPVLNAVPVAERVDILAAKHSDIDLRVQSSSGGVFSALAENVLARGGSVCAAMYDDDFTVVHYVSCDRADLARFRGAKYSQSCVEQCFPEIRSMLFENIPVLFVGTPCQTAGLRRYLGKDYENLWLVDMVCHGVPSPAVWQKYLYERAQNVGSAITYINMRSKSSGWSRYGYSVEQHYDSGTVYSVKQGQDWFMQGFTSNLFLRPSCSHCSFKGVERCSDLTLGDCWGIWETHSEFDDNVGTSLLLLQSEKGRKLWDEVKPAFSWIEITLEEAVCYNPSIVCSSPAHPARTLFFEGLEDVKCITERTKDYLSAPEIRKATQLNRFKNKLFPRKRMP